MLTGKSLTGQVAIVTGASRGIGKAVARALAAEGATVIINYNGSAEAAEAVAMDIRSHGGVAEAVKCNVADFAESEAFVKAVTEKYGRVDILVNNAGITRDNLIVRMTEEEFNAVMDTNLKGAFHMIKHLGRTFMKQRYGKIMNISSVSAAADRAVTNHGSRLFDSLFHGVFQDDAWRMIIVEHGPVGRFAEVFERSTIGFELDRWTDGSRVSLFVISSFSVDIYHLSVVIRMNLDESVLHDEPFQFLLA